MDGSDDGMAFNTDNNSMLTLHLDLTENTLPSYKNTARILNDFISSSRERPKLLRAVGSIDGKITRWSIANPSKASPKAPRQESLYSLMGMSGILIGVSSTTFFTS